MFGDPPDPATTVKVTQMLQERARDPTFNMCLAFIASAKQAPPLIRQMAALRLKNNINRYFDVAIRPNLAQIQPLLLAGLADDVDAIRRAMASGVSEVAYAGGVAALGPLIAQLLQQLQQSQPLSPQRAGCLVGLRNICDDCVFELSQPPAAGQPAVATTLTPQLVRLLTETTGLAAQQHSKESVAEVLLVLESLHFLMGDESCVELPHQDSSFVPELLNDLKSTMNTATAIAAAAPEEAKKLQCAALRSYKLVAPHYQLLKQSGVLSEIIQLIYRCTSDPDPELSLAACSFWREMALNPLAVHDIAKEGLMAQLVEQLVNKMVYGATELAMLEEEQRRVDLKPCMPRRRKAGDDEEGEDDDEVQQSTVRTCAACTLDSLGSTLGADLLQPRGTQPGWFLTHLLEPRLNSTDYLQREAAVLALGAIATGCTGPIMPHLPGLVQTLFGIVADAQQQHFLVRSIACWTLSRYCGWISCNQHVQQGGTPLLTTYVDVLLAAMTDNTSVGARTVQYRAVTAFGVLLPAARDNILQPEYIRMITSRVAPCLLPQNHASPANPRGFTTRSLTMLLEALGMLCMVAGVSLATPEVQQCIFDPLFLQLLPSVPSDNVHLLPLVLSCSHFAVRGLGTYAWPYAPQLFQRMLALVVECVARQQASAAPGSTVDPPDTTNGWWGLEIATSIVEEMGDTWPGEVEELAIRATLPGQTQSMAHCALTILSAAPEVGFDQHILRQAMSFIAPALQRFPTALIGSVAQQIPQLLRFCAADDELCSDTCWFLGTVVISAASLPPEQQQQLVGQVAQTLVPVLHHHDWHKLLLDNAAVAVARCGLVMPQQMAASLQTFGVPLVTALGRCHADPDGKAQGFLGLAAMLHANFGVMQDPAFLQALFESIATYKKRNSDVTQQVVALLQKLKSAAGAQWPQIKRLFPAYTPHDILAVIS
eukprot:TRINITY_DN680_c1_g2_i1.p1 TRINITY_DN680_c1_g2~~TRINITY_DN680_c1_g2_i1.p1  ORF type:complete len:974 (+),score=331.32 TRINITY_DN680_c1_g2_i1:107-2923(+)